MAYITTKKLGNHVAQQLIESITEPANNVYYMVASKHTEYPDGDDTVPAPTDSVLESDIQIYDEAIFGKKITSSDIIRMAPRYDWTANTVYDMYDHTDGDLFTKQFYATYNSGSTYYIYKVIDNNRGAASTIEPSDTTENATSFVTSDGYRWILLYKMDSATFEKFATADYMPIVTSSNVSSSAVSGALDVIAVTTSGSNYVASLQGEFAADDIKDSIPTISGNNTTYRLSTSASSNTNFYTGSALYISSGTGAGQIRKIVSYNAVTRVAVVDTYFTVSPSSGSNYTVAPWVEIVGDGSGAKAYAEVSSNSTVSNYVNTVQIVSRGNNYTYATATIVGNTGGVSNSAVLKVIVPPPGGHGSDVPAELGSSEMGVSVTFNTTESGYITTENDFRTLAVLKDPLFNNVTLSLTDIIGTFETGETINQVKYKSLIGTVDTDAACTIITGINTDFSNCFEAGDNVIIFNTSGNQQCIRTVESITNSTSLTLTSTPDFNSTYATIAYAYITATGVKTGNVEPYILMSNTVPKFITGRSVIGSTSGAWANVSAIDVQEKGYNNWSTFDNRVRLGYTSNTGAFVEDSVVYQSDRAITNAHFHSANSSFVFLTSEKGIINPDSTEALTDGVSEYVLSGDKYQQDIIKESGEILYIENNTPISRSNSQSETIRLILKF